MKRLSVLLLGLQVNCADATSDWQLGPFEKHSRPILNTDVLSEFICPVLNRPIYWEEKDVFNPAAVIKDGKVHLLYRAEDKVGRHAGTSRIGLAVSDDGINFTKRSTPVLYPDNDAYKYLEWEGGTEDPRITKSPDGEYIMTYTAYDGAMARLMMATSLDLIHWTKKGLMFPDFAGWSKSGAIVSKETDDGEFIAEKLNGYYWMYWGDSSIFLARSEDLNTWEIISDEKGEPLAVMVPRPGYFDSDLVEPGPQAILRQQGIVLLYNSRNKAHAKGGTQDLPEGTYSTGQVLFDKEDPRRLTDRSANFFMKPEAPYETEGQVRNVVFIEGLVRHNNKYFLYYGTADSLISVAILH